MSPEEAMERINIVLAHTWMVRTFLKRAEELEADDKMLAVQRMIITYIRSVEPTYDRIDAQEYLYPAGVQMPRLLLAAAYFAREYLLASDHTNFKIPRSACDSYV